MNRCLPFVMLVALLLAPRPIASQEDDVRIQAIPLAEGLHMLVGRGGNIAVSSGVDGSFLIDDQYAPLTDKIRNAVTTLGPGPIRFVLNTHWHADHTGGNENLGKAGSLIVAHENVRRRMQAGQFMEGLRRQVPPAPEAALPVVTFDSGVTFHWNDEEIQVRHVAPAHTDGDSIVWFRKAGAVHMGDTYFNGFYPFIDLSSGGSIEGMIAAVSGVLGESDANTKVIPGHGPLSGRDELVVYRDMLVTVRDRARASIARGESSDEFVASEPTADLDPEWGDGFMEPRTFQRIVYQDLSR